MNNFSSDYSICAKVQFSILTWIEQKVNSECAKLLFMCFCLILNVCCSACLPTNISPKVDCLSMIFCYQALYSVEIRLSFGKSLRSKYFYLKFKKGARPFLYKTWIKKYYSMKKRIIKSNAKDESKYVKVWFLHTLDIKYMLIEKSVYNLFYISILAY